MTTWRKAIGQLGPHERRLMAGSLSRYVEGIDVSTLSDQERRGVVEQFLDDAVQALEEEPDLRVADPWDQDPADQDAMTTVETQKAEVWEAYPAPDEARARVAKAFKQERLDTPEDAVDEALGQLEPLLEDTQDLDQLADETGLDREALRRLVPKILDDDRSDHAGPAILRERSEHTPDPIRGLIDGNVAMVGSLPGGLRCGEHMIVRCQPCYEKWADDEQYESFPHPYARTDQPVGCETPDCEACKPIYVPTRAAAVAIRVQRFLEDVDEDVVLRHVVVSPPWDTLDELAQENYGVPDREDLGQIETDVAELVEKKGAIASILVRHPWRGWWGDRPWRESWHFHVLAAFPRGQAPDTVTPDGWSHEFVPGGQTCCQHATAYSSPDGDGHTGPCCEGDCQDPGCPHHRIANARSEVRGLAGKLGAATRQGDMTRVHRLRDRLDHAQAELATAHQASCDQGYVFRVLEDQDGKPKEVSTDPYELKGGACEGMTVPEGVLALVQYELDHAGSIRDREGRTKMHTVKWFGDWSYRNLELGHEAEHAIQQLKDGLDQAECPNCGNTGLLPVRDSTDHREALILLNDTDLRAQRLKQIELAREMGWLPDERGHHAPQDSDATATPT